MHTSSMHKGKAMLVTERSDRFPVCLSLYKKNCIKQREEVKADKCQVLIDNRCAEQGESSYDQYIVYCYHINFPC